MDLQKEILAIFESYNPHDFDPSACLLKCQALLDQVCSVGNEFDPLSEKKAEEACNAYGFVSHQFRQNGYSSAAISILHDAWNRFSLIQRDEKKRVYRAGIAMYLAKTYLALGDKGGALRWALLTQADDLLGQHESGGGAGKQLLRTTLGMGDRPLGEFAQIAQQNLHRVRADFNNDWSVPSAYAEDVVTQFAFKQPEFSYLFAAPSSEVLEFPLCPAYFEALIERVNSGASEGKWLEDLATYLFLLIPGLVPRRNLLEETLAFETDIIVRNLLPSSNVVADLLGRHFLVECKNWSSRVGVQDVGYFLYRMRLTHSNFGIIFAKSGITGDEHQERAAYSLIRKSFHEDGNVCIVIDNDSLIGLLRSKLSFWSMLLDRVERMRFGKVR